MNKNDLINQSLSANNDWILIVLIAVIIIISIASHINRLKEEKKLREDAQRWLISGQWVVCEECSKKYQKSTLKGQKIPVCELPEDYFGIKCADCGKGTRIK